MPATTIISLRLNAAFTFFMPDEGGYVWLAGDDETGAQDRQICHGGAFRGRTVTAAPATFETVCHQWYRDRLHRMEREGIV